MDLETYDLSFYMSLCNKDEIDRIKDPKNESDYLLKLRANVTVEQVRIFRVFLARMRKAGNEWSFSNSFESKVFDDYLSRISSDDAELVKHIPAGLVFCNDPNGRIIKTKYGNIITISESLKYFLYFMTLSLASYEDCDIPYDVRYAALKIGLRIMLKSEALDFDIDPRGEIPDAVHSQTLDYVDQQLLFIVAHEYSHYFLGHMGDPNLIDDVAHNILEGVGNKIPKYYTHEQQEEFDADIDAIERQCISPASMHKMITSAAFFFSYLELLRNVNDQIAPSFNRIKTHPDPLDRIDNLINHFSDRCDIDFENIQMIKKNIEILIPFVQEDIAVNIESWEDYGSVYLGGWRGKVLIDRVDY
ncbi:hypothetical protein ACNY68_10210 [Pantoea sp. KXB25]|uniref:hypothetical protein n=1 Tax=unclassified Pantoea TaxID=2630326 RepID=UPI003AB6FC93